MSRNRHFHLLAITSVATLALAGCGGSGGGSVESTKSAAPMPPVMEMDAAMNAPAPQPLPLSGDDTLTPVVPAATTTTTTTVTTPAAPESLAPAASTVTTSGPMTTDERIARLENSVASLRSDYDRIMPAFASLNTTNERIQTLLDEMETSGKIPAAPKTTTTVTTKTTETAPVVTASKTVVKTAPTAEDKMADETKSAPVADAPKSSGGANTVTAVRVGEHGSKTRLVFDLSSKTKPDFKYDLDNGEKLLVVDLPSSTWSGKQSGKPNSPLISGWTAQAGANGGSSVAIQLKSSARVLSTEFLKAEGKDPARLVMDIAAGN